MNAEVCIAIHFTGHVFCWYTNL